MSEALPYEMHVTVEATQKIKKFIGVCRELGVKAIVLDLGIHTCGDLSDYMTSSKAIHESDEAAFTEVNRIADGLNTSGFSVIRRKIETAPWHVAAPQKPGEVMPTGSYFESHLAIQCAEQEIPTLRAAIAKTADKLPLYISRNVFKQVEDGKIVIMSTLRDYERSYQEFSDQVAESIDKVGELGFKIHKPPITEFSLYDSDIHHDDAWMVKPVT